MSTNSHCNIHIEKNKQKMHQKNYIQFNIWFVNILSEINVFSCEFYTCLFWRARATESERERAWEAANEFGGTECSSSKCYMYLIPRVQFQSKFNRVTQRIQFKLILQFFLCSLLLVQAKIVWIVTVVDEVLNHIHRKYEQIF